MSNILEPARLGLVLLLALAQVAVGAEEYKTEETTFPCDRLPTHVRPTHSDIDLTMLDFSISGRVSIRVQIVPELKPRKKHSRISLKRLFWCYQEPCTSESNESQESCVSNNFLHNEIVLHADKSLEILKVRFWKYVVGNFEGKRRKEVGIKKLVRDPEKQMVSIVLAEDLEPGSEGVLKLDFSSKMAENDVFRGIYRSRFNNDDYFTSQFQPTDARRVIPCFDEPQFKAKFQLTIHHPSSTTALANTEIDEMFDKAPSNLMTTRFKRSPLMSIHMVAFTVGPYDFVERVDVGKRKTRVRVYTAHKFNDSAQFALDLACKSIEHMEEYTGIEYPLEKFDIVAAPEHDKDNTESWGLAFVRANVTLLDKETRDDFKITIGINVAHVVAHQWFANLVTAKWWDDLWITESVAAQKAFEILQELHPEYDSEYFVRLSLLSGVLQSDSHVVQGLHALAPAAKDFSSTDTIYNIFDVLEFMKSASLAQLIQNDIGETKFQEVLKLLLNKHAYGSVEFYDYAASFEEVTKAKNYLNKFMTQLYSPSYPVLNVASEDGKLTLERKKLQAEELGVSVEFFDASGQRGQLMHNLGRGSEFKLPKWFKWNDAQYWFKLNPMPDISTYFRVNYSDSLIESNFKHAIENQLLTPLDRLNVLDDAVGLVEAGEASPETLKTLLDYYRNEDNGGVILEMLVASKVLSSLKLIDLQTSPTSQVFLNIYQRYGFNATESKSFLDTRAQMATLSSLVQMGKPEVIAAALKKFDESPDGLVPELHLREPIYMAVVKSGTPAQVELLLKHLHVTESYEEIVRLLDALIQTSDEGVLKYLKSYLQRAPLPSDTKLQYNNSLAVLLSRVP